jgi:hypothetical protein
MNTSPSAGSFIGHVKNGVIVPDAYVPLREGQAVRIEPLGDGTPRPDKQSADRLHELQRLFAEWTQEDGKLSEQDADCLHTALEQNAGLDLHEPTLD